MPCHQLHHLIAVLPGRRPATPRRAGGKRAASAAPRLLRSRSGAAWPRGQQGAGRRSPGPCRTARPASLAGSRAPGPAPSLSSLADLLGMMGQDPADHVFLAGRQVDLRRGEPGMTEHELHVGQRQRRILGHPVGRRVPQRVQRRRRACPAGGTLEHPVHRMIGQRPERPAQRPPQRLAAAARDQPVHLRLVKPQPDERVGRCGQFLHLAGSLADHGDHLPPGIDPALGDRQQLRGPGTGRDVERDQGPVPVRASRAKISLNSSSGTLRGHALRHPRPVKAGPLVPVGLHRIMVRVRPPPRRERSSGNGFMIGPVPASRWKS